MRCINKSTISGAVPAFSLIELMVVVAIISMLAVVATPSYSNYVMRSRVASLLPLVESVKIEVMEGHSFGTTFGVTSEVHIASGASDKPEYLDQLVRHNYGCVMVDYDLTQLGLESGGGEALELMVCPSAGSSIVTWNCGYSASTTVAYATYLPAQCQQAVVTDNTF